MTEPKVVIAQLTPEQMQRLKQAADWVVETCFLFGTSPGTAYRVAGLFAEGLAEEWLKPS